VVVVEEAYVYVLYLYVVDVVVVFLFEAGREPFKFCFHCFNLKTKNVMNFEVKRNFVSKIKFNQIFTKLIEIIVSKR